MSNRDKLSILFFTLGLSIAGVGVAMPSQALTLAGLFAIAVTVRYRNRPPVWEYFSFLALLAFVFVALVALPPPSSPLIGAIPLMLSYVFDYIDERRSKRVTHPPGNLVAGDTRAEPGAKPNGGSASQPDILRGPQGKA